MNKHKFEINKGDTLDFALDVAEDCQNWTGTMPVYDRLSNLVGSVDLTFRLDNYIDGTASTASWPVGKYSYYLRVTKDSGVIEDILEGDICVE